MSLTWSLQALLVRHETYVAEAEAERKQMKEEIDRITCDRDALQTQNNEVIEENRQLLFQLESANTAVTDSETHVKSLSATLQSAQEELHRLNALARRTQNLEKELERFELEQSRLRTSVANKAEDERAANLRWQNAERSLAAMEEHVHSIEAEAKAEREHHLEVVGRLERRRQIEKELGTPAGRPLSIASTGSDTPRPAVVSHFVKDILQDNANLQMDIVELRGLLNSANEQVEKLREHMSDQPLQSDSDTAIMPALQPSPNLDQELAVQERPRTASQEVHVHHHYHAPTAKPEPARRQSQLIRRPRKRRQVVSFGRIQSSADCHTPSNLSISSVGFPTPTSSQMHSSPGSQPPHRWSMLSSAPPSSVPSSPRSHQSPSLFDKSFSDADLDSSRPTTPGTDAGDIPYFPILNTKTHPLGFYQSLGESLQADFMAQRTPTHKQIPRSDSNLLLAEIEDEEQDPEHSLVDFSQPVPHLRPQIRSRAARPKSFTDDDLPSSIDVDFDVRSLHRSTSHESLLSVSGMDIHTLKSRPSQMLTGQGARSFSSQPTISVTTAQADRPKLNSKSSQAMLASVAGESVEQNAGLGRRVSGWMFSKWTSSPAQPSPLNPARSDNNNSGGDATAKVTGTAAAASTMTKSQVRNNQIKLRPPGINQPGAILGFLADNPPSTRLKATSTTATTATAPPMSTGPTKTTMTLRPSRMMPIMSILDEEELRQSLTEFV